MSPNPYEHDDVEDRAIDQEQDHGQVPLLQALGEGIADASAPLTSTRRLLYTSHFLSTWNSRAFEFGAFLFLATIYPDTLLPASIYALARNASAVLFSSFVGKFVDLGNRLVVVRVSIIGQRSAVAASCILLLSMAQFEQLRTEKIVSYVMLAGLGLLACVEKLSAVLNTIAVERDWVVIIAGDDEASLRTMNSQMRRIDLFCKLAAPLFVSLIDGASSKVAIIVTGAMTATSVAIEYVAIARVFAAVPALGNDQSSTDHVSAQRNAACFPSIKELLSESAIYFRHRAFLPSFSLALLYLTVLSFSGQMITYLLAIGVPSAAIGALRGVSAIFELSATWLGPKVMQRIGSIRAGIWFINWQMFCVTVACLFFWLDHRPWVTAVGAVSAVAVSRVGLWGFDLSAQIIVQDEVEAEHRGVFSSHEFAFQNAFEMLSFASTIVFARPQDFKYPASISAAAVGVAGILYALFVRLRRGHLVHWSRCIERHGKNPATGGNARTWQRVRSDEEAEGGIPLEHEPH